MWSLGREVIHSFVAIPNCSRALDVDEEFGWIGQFVMGGDRNLAQ